MSAADAVIAGLVLAGALYLLYRSFARRGGACHGCDGAGCRPAPNDVVRLGRAPAPRPGEHPRPGR